MRIPPAALRHCPAAGRATTRGGAPTGQPSARAWRRCSPAGRATRARAVPPARASPARGRPTARRRSTRQHRRASPRPRAPACRRSGPSALRTGGNGGSPGCDPAVTPRPARDSLQPGPEPTASDHEIGEDAAWNKPSRPRWPHLSLGDQHRGSLYFEWPWGVTICAPWAGGRTGNTPSVFPLRHGSMCPRMSRGETRWAYV